MFYNTTQAPDWHVGNIAIVFNVLSVAYTERRDRNGAVALDGVIQEDKDV